MELQSKIIHIELTHEFLESCHIIVSLTQISLSFVVIVNGNGPTEGNSTSLIHESGDIVCEVGADLLIHEFIESTFLLDFLFLHKRKMGASFRSSYIVKVAVNSILCSCL